MSQPLPIPFNDKMTAAALQDVRAALFALSRVTERTPYGTVCELLAHAERTSLGLDKRALRSLRFNAAGALQKMLGYYLARKDSLSAAASFCVNEFVLEHDQVAVHFAGLVVTLCRLGLAAPAQAVAAFVADFVEAARVPAKLSESYCLSLNFLYLCVQRMLSCQLTAGAFSMSHQSLLAGAFASLAVLSRALPNEASPGSPSGPERVLVQTTQSSLLSFVQSYVLGCCDPAGVALPLRGTSASGFIGHHFRDEDETPMGRHYMLCNALEAGQSSEGSQLLAQPAEPVSRQEEGGESALKRALAQLEQISDFAQMTAIGTLHSLAGEATPVSVHSLGALSAVFRLLCCAVLRLVRFTAVPPFLPASLDALAKCKQELNRVYEEIPDQKARKKSSRASQAEQAYQAAQAAVVGVRVVQKARDAILSQAHTLIYYGLRILWELQGQEASLRRRVQQELEGEELLDHAHSLLGGCAAALLSTANETLLIANSALELAADRSGLCKYFQGPTLAQDSFRDKVENPDALTRMERKSFALFLFSHVFPTREELSKVEAAAAARAEREANVLSGIFASFASSGKGTPKEVGRNLICLLQASVADEYGFEELGQRDAQEEPPKVFSAQSVAYTVLKDRRRYGAYEPFTPSEMRLGLRSLGLWADYFATFTKVSQDLRLYFTTAYVAKGAVLQYGDNAHVFASLLDLVFPANAIDFAAADIRAVLPRPGHVSIDVPDQAFDASVATPVYGRSASGGAYNPLLTSRGVLSTGAEIVASLLAAFGTSKYDFDLALRLWAHRLWKRISGVLNTAPELSITCSTLVSAAYMRSAVEKLMFPLSLGAGMNSNVSGLSPCPGGYFAAGSTHSLAFGSRLSFAAEVSSSTFLALPAEGKDAPAPFVTLQALSAVSEDVLQLDPVISGVGLMSQVLGAISRLLSSETSGGRPGGACAPLESLFASSVSHLAQFRKEALFPDQEGRITYVFYHSLANAVVQALCGQIRAIEPQVLREFCKAAGGLAKMSAWISSAIFSELALLLASMEENVDSVYPSAYSDSPPTSQLQCVIDGIADVFCGWGASGTELSLSHKRELFSSMASGVVILRSRGHELSAGYRQQMRDKVYPCMAEEGWALAPLCFANALSDDSDLFLHAFRPVFGDVMAFTECRSAPEIRKIVSAADARGAFPEEQGRVIVILCRCVDILLTASFAEPFRVWEVLHSLLFDAEAGLMGALVPAVWGLPGLSSDPVLSHKGTRRLSQSRGPLHAEQEAALPEWGWSLVDAFDFSSAGEADRGRAEAELFVSLSRVCCDAADVPARVSFMRSCMSIFAHRLSRAFMDVDETARILGNVQAAAADIGVGGSEKSGAGEAEQQSDKVYALTRFFGTILAQPDSLPVPDAQRSRRGESAEEELLVIAAGYASPGAAESRSRRRYVSLSSECGPYHWLTVQMTIQMFCIAVDILYSLCAEPLRPDRVVRVGQANRALARPVADVVPPEEAQSYLCRFLPRTTLVVGFLAQQIRLYNNALGYGAFASRWSCALLNSVRNLMELIFEAYPGISEAPRPLQLQPSLVLEALLPLSVGEACGEAAILYLELCKLCLAHGALRPSVPLRAREPQYNRESVYLSLGVSRAADLLSPSYLGRSASAAAAFDVVLPGLITAARACLLPAHRLALVYSNVYTGVLLGPGLASFAQASLARAGAGARPTGARRVTADVVDRLVDDFRFAPFPATLAPTGSALLSTPAEALVCALPSTQLKPLRPSPDGASSYSFGLYRGGSDSSYFSALPSVVREDKRLLRDKTLLLEVMLRRDGGAGPWLLLARRCARAVAAELLTDLRQNRFPLPRFLERAGAATRLCPALPDQILRAVASAPKPARAFLLHTVESYFSVADPDSDFCIKMRELCQSPRLLAAPARHTLLRADAQDQGVPPGSAGGSTAAFDGIDEFEVDGDEGAGRVSAGSAAAMRSVASPLSPVQDFLPAASPYLPYLQPAKVSGFQGVNAFGADLGRPILDTASIFTSAVAKGVVERAAGVSGGLRHILALLSVETRVPRCSEEAAILAMKIMAILFPGHAGGQDALRAVSYVLSGSLARLFAHSEPAGQDSLVLRSLHVLPLASGRLTDLGLSLFSDALQRVSFMSDQRDGSIHIWEPLFNEICEIYMYNLASELVFPTPGASTGSEHVEAIREPPALFALASRPEPGYRGAVYFTTPARIADDLASRGQTGSSSASRGLGRARALSSRFPQLVRTVFLLSSERYACRTRRITTRFFTGVAKLLAVVAFDDAKGEAKVLPWLPALLGFDMAAVSPVQASGKNPGKEHGREAMRFSLCDAGPDIQDVAYHYSMYLQAVEQGRAPAKDAVVFVDSFASSRITDVLSAFPEQTLGLLCDYMAALAEAGLQKGAAFARAVLFFLLAQKYRGCAGGGPRDPEADPLYSGYTQELANRVASLLISNWGQLQGDAAALSCSYLSALISAEALTCTDQLCSTVLDSAIASPYYEPLKQQATQLVFSFNSGAVSEEDQEKYVLEMLRSAPTFRECLQTVSRTFLQNRFPEMVLLFLAANPKVTDGSASTADILAVFQKLWGCYPEELEESLQERARSFPQTLDGIRRLLVFAAVFGPRYFDSILAGRLDWLEDADSESTGEAVSAANSVAGGISSTHADPSEGSGDFASFAAFEGGESDGFGSFAEFEDASGPVSPFGESDAGDFGGFTSFTGLSKADARTGFDSMPVASTMAPAPHTAGRAATLADLQALIKDFTPLVRYTPQFCQKIVKAALIGLCYEYSPQAFSALYPSFTALSSFHDPGPDFSLLVTYSIYLVQQHAEISPRVMAFLRGLLLKDVARTQEVVRGLGAEEKQVVTQALREGSDKAGEAGAAKAAVQQAGEGSGEGAGAGAGSSPASPVPPAGPARGEDSEPPQAPERLAAETEEISLKFSFL